jgi:hypothetical protein
MNHMHAKGSIEADTGEASWRGSSFVDLNCFCPNGTTAPPQLEQA